jgi:hypothetical protein
MALVPSTPLGAEVANASDHALSSKPESSVTITVKETASDAQSTNEEDDNFLIVSPYTEKPHLLDLRTLDTANQVLARALTGLKCLRGDYATAPYTEIFNWSEVIESVRTLAAESDFEWKENYFYIVVFRSQIPPSTVYADLGVLDKAAHAEATKSGGFLR